MFGIHFHDLFGTVVEERRHGQPHYVGQVYLRVPNGAISANTREAANTALVEKLLEIRNRDGHTPPPASVDAYPDLVALLAAMEAAFDDLESNEKVDGERTLQRALPDLVRELAGLRATVSRRGTAAK